MSQENVELLRNAYEAFARGDVEAVLERLDRDVDWRPAIAPILGVDAVRGSEAVRDFLTRDCSRDLISFGPSRSRLRTLAMPSWSPSVTWVGARAAALSSIRPSPRSTDCGMAKP